MKLCFPVEQDQGIDSLIYGHFGSAPHFLIVDAETGLTTIIDNHDENHVHGACNPARAVQGLAIEGIVVGGIGRGALMSLNRAGLRVFQAHGARVRDNLALLQTDGLQEFAPGSVCGGHSHTTQEHVHNHSGGCCH